jgi:hypothetical protein
LRKVCRLKSQNCLFYGINCLHTETTIATVCGVISVTDWRGHSDGVRENFVTTPIEDFLSFAMPLMIIDEV